MNTPITEADEILVEIGFADRPIVAATLARVLWRTTLMQAEYAANGIVWDEVPGWVRRNPRAAMERAALILVALDRYITSHVV